MLAWWHCWYVLAWYLLLMLVVMLCFGEVCTGIVHASQYAMLSGYDSLLIWWIVMWYHHDYVDIMFMHYNWHHVILSWLIIFAFKFNRIKLNWNNCWLSHGATILSWPVQPRLPLWEGPNWVYWCASRRCLQRGKVMGVRYPGPVSRHNLVCSFVFMVPCPCLGPFCHDGGRRCLW